jgi:hypothetical protein
MPQANASEIQKIGFNEAVEVSSRRMHVQTEVFVMDRVLVKTTVLEGGVVRFVDTETCPTKGWTLQQIEAFVFAQHARNVSRMRRTRAV